MQILIPSTVRAATIFLILSSPHGCICLTSLKITSTQGRMYQSLRLWIPNKKVCWVRHRSWTWTDPYSFEQATWQTWCNSETSAVKAGATNVWDNAILPPTVSGDGAGWRFVSTDGVRRWRWGALLCVTAVFASLFRSMSQRLVEFPKNRPFLHFFGGTLKSKASGSHGGVGWELRRL